MFDAKARPGGFGHTAGKQAAQIHEIHLPNCARKNAGEQEWQHGHAHTGE
jgi:hypothetical protein